jgi:hypothetical protein
MRNSGIVIAIAAAFALDCAPDPVAAHAIDTASVQGGNILYDQSGSPTSGAVSQNFDSAHDSFDTAVADDFVVGDSAGWDVVQFDFQTGSGPGTDLGAVTFDVMVFDDAGGLPAATTACAYSNLPGVLTNSDTALSVALPSLCHLQPGTYWISEMANLAWDDGLFIWSAGNPSPVIGLPGMLQNPGGGTGSTCTTWAPIVACNGGNGSNNLLFQVRGTVSDNDLIFCSGFRGLDCDDSI